MQFKFTKMHGMGNDYVTIKSETDGYDWSRIGIKLLDRHYGIGGDSLLVILPSRNADFRMRIIDTDGSEAESCGNGIRCLARYVYEKGLIKPGTPRITVETLAGIRYLNLFYTGNELTEIQANMGKPGFKAEEVPVITRGEENSFAKVQSMLQYHAVVDSSKLLLNLVSMGNPHAVYFWDRPVAEFPMPNLGPKVEVLKVFPNRVNFEVARVLNPTLIEVRVWERGVGETLACGTGACATAAAAQTLGKVGAKVDIKLMGGTLKVERNGGGEMLLSGPAEIVFEGEWTGEV